MCYQIDSILRMFTQFDSTLGMKTVWCLFTVSIPNILSNRVNILNILSERLFSQSDSTLGMKTISRLLYMQHVFPGMLMTYILMHITVTFWLVDLTNYGYTSCI